MRKGDLSPAKRILASTIWVKQNGFATIMSKKRMLLVMGAGVSVLAIAFVLYAYYQFTHNFRIALTPKETDAALTALKGAMGEAIFNGQQQLSPTVQSVHQRGPGLIEAYRKDPQKFKRYAEMLDSAMNAKKVGDVLLQENNAHLPKTTNLLVMDKNVKLDAWGNPFCIIPVKGKVAIVSGGPSHLACDALPLTPEQIATSSRTLYAAPLDVVVVTVTQPSANR